MKRQILVAGILAALGPLAGVGMAAQYNTSSNPSNAQNVNPSNQKANPPSSRDRTFADGAAQANLSEIKIGELAEKNGGTAQVKDFGKRMVQDHTKLDNELKLDAAKEDIQLPTNISSKDQATYDRLSKLSGTAFDRAYARDMVSGHEKDISEFQKEVQDGRNATIKDYASNSTPILQEHLNLARDMQNTVSVSSKTTSKNKAG